MPGKYCAVFGCNNHEIQRDARSFFRFPKNKQQCDLWVLNCRRADLNVVYKKEGPMKLYSTYKICSDHFLLSDFRNPRLLSQGLKPGSIPSQNLPNSSFATRRGSPKKQKRDEYVGSDCTISDSDQPENDVNYQLSSNLRGEKPKLNQEGAVKLYCEKLRRIKKVISKKNKEIRQLRSIIQKLNQDKIQESRTYS